MAKGVLTLKSTYALPASAVPYGLCVSPDNKNAYVVLSSGSPVGLVQLAISQADGSLGQIGTQPFTLSNPGGRRAAVSPDGKCLCMVATGWDRLYVYTRSATDGSLTAPSTPYYSSGVSYPVYVKFSPDNAHVYVANNNSGGSSGNIQVYSCNTTTGVLTLIQTVGLVGAVGIEVTPDGTGVFASANPGSGTINGYTRDNNPASGTYGQLTSSGSWAVDGQIPNAVGISTDSATVYVLSDSAPQYTSCFSRNTSTNVLTNIGHPAINSGNNSGNWAIALGQDNPSSALYAAESDGQMIAQYTRNADGTLTAMTPVSAQTSNYGMASPQGGVSKGPYGLAVLPNNQYLYATALGTDSVDVFAIDQGGPPAVTGVTISPTSATVNGGDQKQFTGTAAVTGGASASVTYGDDGGSITSSGLWTAPAATGVPQTFHVTVTSVYDNTKSAMATITVPAKKATSETVQLVDANGNPLANLSGLKWAFFDQVTPDAFAAPSVKGTGGTTDASGNFTANITGTTLISGAVGWLTVSDSDGTLTQSPGGRVFSGPVAVV